MKSKYPGIDSRDIKCCSENPNSVEAGISFDEDEEGNFFLIFHFLDYLGNTKILMQKSKSMQLNKASRDQLVTELKKLRFKNKN